MLRYCSTSLSLRIATTKYPRFWVLLPYNGNKSSPSTVSTIMKDATISKKCGSAEDNIPMYMVLKNLLNAIGLTRLNVSRKKRLKPINDILTVIYNGRLWK